ncbi:MAG: permease [Candidatus Delongbacteria bacterium]|nr:permease [Candidatus Delongbacteria bacterium]MBN2836904.1 permease [Candidatus Delongbacteria bacterium]
MKKALYICLLILWFVFYYFWKDIVDYVIFELFEMAKGEHLTEAIHFFIYDTVKVSILLILIVFLVGIMRSYFSATKTRNWLEGKPLFLGNVLAALLGIVTPFCSCSAVPLFLGFVEVGIPLGVTFSFLIAAPMINEVALILLWDSFGSQVAIMYIVTGLVVAISAGYIIGKLKLEKYVEDWVYNIKTSGKKNIVEANLTFDERLDFAKDAVFDILRKVWLYILIGIAVGAGIHGYVPENFMASFMGKDAWWSVPFAVILGIPMYSNAAGVVPIIQALWGKGAALGTSLSFMMSVIALSLPEMIILRKVLKIPMLIIFISIVGAGIILVGYIFNLLI